jgi:hypothetical protein
MGALVTPNGAGKSSGVVAALALWWVSVHPRGRVVITTKTPSSSISNSSRPGEAPLEIAEMEVALLAVPGNHHADWRPHRRLYHQRRRPRGGLAQGGQRRRAAAHHRR